MNKKIIIQGRPFTFPACGLKTFTKNFFYNLTRALPDNDFEILLPSQIDQEEFNLPANCSFKVIPPVDTTPEYLSTSLWENTQVSDYVSSLDKSSIAFFLSPYHCLPIKKMDVPTYIVLHDIHLWKEPDARWPFIRRYAYEIKEKSIFNADTIFTVSNFTKKEIESYYSVPSEKIIPIYEDIDPFYREFTPDKYINIEEKYGLKKDEYFLYIGSYEPRKNVETIFKAYKEYISKSNTKSKLAIVGFHTERSKEIDSFQGSDNESIVMLPTLTLAEIATLYAKATAFLYPSFYEGFGLQLLEAQTLSCPVIASDIEVFHEVAGDGALYFNPHAHIELASKMLGIENDTDIKHNITAKGKVNINRYSWNKTVDAFLIKLTSGKIL